MSGRDRRPEATPGPPAGAMRLLVWAFRNDPARSAILGDLRAEFVRIRGTRGAVAARLWYWREAIGLGAGRVVHKVVRGAARGWAQWGVLYQDVGHAMRVLRRNSGFTAFAALVLGLGVGAATTVYSVLRPLVLAPLPFQEPHQLVWIENDETPGDSSLSAITSRTANLHDFRERARSFEGLTGYNGFFRQTAYTLTGGGEPERLVGVGVAHDFLQVLGVRPLYGRAFSVEEGEPGGPGAVILSHGFWLRRFAADPGVVGRSITLDGTARTVVGVLPPTFDFSSVFAPGADVDLLLPFPVLPASGGGFQGNTMFLIGRLAPGVGIEAAASELDALIVALGNEQPARWGLGAAVTPLAAHVAGPFRPLLLVLVAAAGALLLIVCVNTSNLLLARSPGRVRELAVRGALGASRARLMRQLVLESVGIGLAGAIVGAALASGATRIVAGMTGIEIPMLERVTVDGSAFLVATAVAVLAGLIVGLVPALRVGGGTGAELLRTAAGRASAPRSVRSLRETLVVAQVTLVCVLLVGGGLLTRSLRAVLDVDLGFDPENVVAWQLNATRSFDSEEDRSGYFAAVADRVAAIPGVERAGVIDAAPLGRDRSWSLSVVGSLDPANTDVQVHPHIIDTSYLETMRIPVLAGRAFNGADIADSRTVVLINDAGARRFFADTEHALGHRVRVWGPWEWEVVGIVDDVRHLSPEIAPGIQVYFPITQMRDFASVDLVVRSSLPVDRLVTAVAAALREFDPAMPTGEFWTMRSRVAGTTSARRFTIAVLAAYGATALFLAALGIYGVLGHTVAQRRPEIGIRMALGASAPRIVRGVLGRTLVLAMIGIGLGGVMSLLGGRLLDSLLFGIAPTDPVTYGTTAFMLLLVALAAGAVPAARAARVRGVSALQAD